MHAWYIIVGLTCFVTALLFLASSSLLQLLLLFFFYATHLFVAREQELDYGVPEVVAGV